VFALTSELALAQGTTPLLTGTRLRVRLDTAIASSNARPGDAVEATLLESIQSTSSLFPLTSLHADVLFSFDRELRVLRDWYGYVRGSAA